MKFIFADNVDLVDPLYDFQKDRSPPDREPYWDDKYPSRTFRKILLITGYFCQLQHLEAKLKVDHILIVK